MLIEHDIFESRSIFYNLEPIGTGTDQVESLTSYISRLCELHNIKTSRFFLYLGETFLPSINKSFPVSSRSRSFNGNGQYNTQLTEALSKLTGRSDLNLLSLYDYSNYIYGREMRKYRAWCPCCLKMDEKTSTVVYDRLLWNFDIIKICHIHNCLLETKCPNCNKEIPILSPTTTIESCHYCNCKLSETTTNKLKSDVENEFQKIIIKEIGQLIALTSEEKELFSKSSIEISDVINEITIKVKDIYGLSLIKFSEKFLKMDRTQVGEWRRGLHKPSLLNLVRLSYVTGIPLIGLLKNNVKIERIQLFPEKYQNFMVFSVHSTYSAQEIKNKLHYIIEEDRYKKYTFNEIAKMIGYLNGSALRDNYPEEHKIISLRRKEYLNDTKRKKEINIEKKFEEIINKLLDMELEPTIANVEKFYPDQIKFFQLKYREVFEKVYRKFIKYGIDQK